MPAMPPRWSARTPRRLGLVYLQRLVVTDRASQSTARSFPINRIYKGVYREKMRRVEPRGRCPRPSRGSLVVVPLIGAARPPNPPIFREEPVGLLPGGFHGHSGRSHLNVPANTGASAAGALNRSGPCPKTGRDRRYYRVTGAALRADCPPVFTPVYWPFVGHRKMIFL